MMDTAGFAAAGAAAVIGEYLRQLLFGSAARARARRAAGIRIYDVTLAGRLLFAAAVLIFAGLIAIIVIDGDDWRITLLLWPFLLLCVFALPGPIRVDATGLDTRRWYGPHTRIPWREVIDVRGPDGLGQVIVIGANGQKIVHIGLHAGAQAFYHDVMTYARVSPSRIVPV